MNPRLMCLIVCVTLRSNKGVSGWDDLWRLMGSNWKLHEQRPFPPCSGSQICQIDRGFASSLSQRKILKACSWETFHHDKLGWEETLR